MVLRFQLTPDGLVPLAGHVPDHADALIVQYRATAPQPLPAGVLISICMDCKPDGTGCRGTVYTAHFEQPRSSPLNPYVCPVDQVDPGYVVRCMVLDACKAYISAENCEPNYVDITPDMEVLLRYHGLRENWADLGTWESPERPARLFGMQAHWGAGAFSVWREEGD